MKTTTHLTLLAAMFAGVFSLFSQTTEAPTDWDKAKQLLQREQRGEKLAEDDQKYLDRAKELRRKGGNRPAAGAAGQRKAPGSLKPLCDMTAEERHEGEDGGLYGKGSNEAPEALKKFAKAELAQIQPLDAGGKPSDNGRIVLVSISMSNA